MKALRVERSLPRFAAARVAGALAPGRAARVGPLHLVDVDPPPLPGPDWVRVRPRLSGICGSDLATVDGVASPWFEPVVSFPFVPGHEVVGDLDADGGGGRVVVEPVLGCAARGIEPRCEGCRTDDVGRCRNIAFGHLEPGLQTGYCADTGGGWSLGLVAHRSQLHAVPETMSDEAAVMVEPTACAIRGALKCHDAGGAVVAVVGAGTLGLCVVAALHRFVGPDRLIVGAKHPVQRRLATELGATVVVEPANLARSVRRATGSMAVGDDGDRARSQPLQRLTGGADVVVDCVGSANSLAQALAIVAPGGRIVMVGMPGTLTVDLTPLWHREVELVGAYAYGAEPTLGRRTFDLALELVAEARLERLVSATYPLQRHPDALAHAADAGRRGAVKVAFDLRTEKGRRS
ncbi:MAG: zinc-binding dehydrogenase [Actinobacteria bacterium]|nr:zinc-binding dehydrogenase [Actinomycetota bacterium]MBW3643469.1 zinc-binding dehydrogenase [Actinomycetota bacterium]